MPLWMQGGKLVQTPDGKLYDCPDCPCDSCGDCDEWPASIRLTIENTGYYCPGDPTACDNCAAMPYGEIVLDRVQSEDFEGACVYEGPFAFECSEPQNYRITNVIVSLTPTTMFLFFRREYIGGGVPGDLIVGTHSQAIESCMFEDITLATSEFGTMTWMPDEVALCCLQGSWVFEAMP